MWEAWTTVVAGLGAAWALARHNPKMFEGFSNGVLFALWPLVGALFAWDFALLAAELTLKSALEPTAFVKATAALKIVSLERGVPAAALLGAIGLQVIKQFVKPSE